MMIQKAAHAPPQILRHISLPARAHIHQVMNTALALVTLAIAKAVFGTPVAVARTEAGIVGVATAVVSAGKDAAVGGSPVLAAVVGAQGLHARDADQTPVDAAKTLAIKAILTGLRREVSRSSASVALETTGPISMNLYQRTNLIAERWVLWSL